MDFQPEKIFLMEQGEPIFLPFIKFYFNHDCNNHFEDHRCLKLTFSLMKQLEKATHPLLFDQLSI